MKKNGCPQIEVPHFCHHSCGLWHCDSDLEEKLDRMIVPPRASNFRSARSVFGGFFWGTNFTSLGDSGIYIYIYTVYMCIYIYTWNPNGSPCFVWSVCLGLGKEDLSKNWLVMAGFTGAKKTSGDHCDSVNGQPYAFHPLIYTSGGIYCVFSFTQWPTFRLLGIPYQGSLNFPFWWNRTMQIQGNFEGLFPYNAWLGLVI